MKTYYYPNAVSPILGQKTMANSTPVVIASDQTDLNVNLSAVSAAPFGVTIFRQQGSAPVRIDYTSTNITTSAYVTLKASTETDSTKLQIFDSSGLSCYLAVGAPGSETNLYIIPPGGIDLEFAIPVNSRLSLKAVTATVNVGEIIANFTN
jgi:hypothetical protein